MTKFTIYTERKNVWALKHLAAAHLGDATMLRAHGTWQGKVEAALIFEHFTINADSQRDKVKSFVRDVNAFNHQTCCLVTEQEMKGEFIG